MHRDDGTRRAEHRRRDDGTRRAQHRRRGDGTPASPTIYHNATLPPTSLMPKRTFATPLTEYDKERAQQMVVNNRRLQALGIHTLAAIVRSSSAKKKGSAKQREDSSYEYDPQEDEATEQDEIDDTLVADKDALDDTPSISTSTPDKVSKNTTKKTSRMPPGGTRPPKRVLASSQPNPPTRVTRQRTKELPLPQSDAASLCRGTGPQQLQVEGHNSLNYDDICATHDALDSAHTPTQIEEQGQMIDEDTQTASRGRGNRGHNKGKGLENLTRGLCSKIPIHIAEGNTRPVAPIQAAKLASEGGIILRQHVPILPHWKEYKRHKSHLTDFIGKVGAQFTMDTNSKPVKDACVDMLKGGQRQRRYMLKKKWFNNVPENEVRTTSPVTSMTDEQWNELVTMWKNERHKDTSAKNKLNREKVQFQQRTGSRSYIAYCHTLKQDFKDGEPTAIDLFKACHLSKKNGYSDPVKKAIADMEIIMQEPVPEGQEPKSATMVVSEVLTQVCPTNKFVQNVGLQSVSKSSSRGGVSLHVQELQAELAMEKQGSNELRQQLASQKEELDAFKKKAEEAEATRSKDFQLLMKRTEDTEAMLAHLLRLQSGPGQS